MNPKIPFDPKGNIFRWGPVPVKFAYVSTFVEVHYKHFRAAYGENWSETLWLFKDSRSLWLNNTPDVEATGEKVFLRYMLPQETREKIYTEWQRDAVAVTALEKKIDGTEFSKISNAEFGNLWQEFISAYIKFWTTGSVPELANYGSVQYLRKQLQGLVPEGELAHVLEVLTAPERISFYQEEEVALSKATDIKVHQKEFFWLKNSYGGTQVLPVEFFKEHQKELGQNFEQQTEEKLAETKARKIAVQKQFSLPTEIMAIAAAISYGIEWQDERKKHIFIILHYLDLFLTEVARRFDYDFERLHDLWHYQISDIIAGKDLRPELAKRQNGFGVRFAQDCEDLYAEDITYLWNLYGTEKIAAGTSELKGIVASKGTGGVVRGKIRILLNPNKAESFVDGEILVAPMTSPEYAFVMKKAVAILTDTGGLTSHAAIVSRELNIPCLVGTKVATTLFKDGDLVEVDPLKGVARKV